MQKVLVIFILGVVIQTIAGQCIGHVFAPCGPYVSSAVLGPGGQMHIYSDDLLISGPVSVSGKLPFSGTVALEGSLPACGAGAVNYGCGEPVGILTETPIGLIAGYGFR